VYGCRSIFYATMDAIQVNWVVTDSLSISKSINGLAEFYHPV